VNLIALITAFALLCKVAASKCSTRNFLMAVILVGYERIYVGGANWALIANQQILNLSVAKLINRTFVGVKGIKNHANG
jgi:hypothetical protein